MIDLYRLLQLQPLETEPAKIEAALIRCLKTAKRAEDPKTRARLKRLHELGSKHLLEPALKQKYDQHWRTEFAEDVDSNSSADNASRSSSFSDSEELLRGLLPAGSPHRDFDLAAYLESTTVSSSSAYDEEFEALMLAIKGSPSQQTLTRDDTRSSQPGSEAAVLTKTATSSATVPSRSAISGDLIKPDGRADKSLARKLRKKSDHSLLMITAGLLLSVAVVLGVVLVVTNNMNDEPDASSTMTTDEQLALQKDRVGKAREEAKRVEQSQAPRGSGLPQPKLPATLAKNPPTPPEVPATSAEVGSVMREQTGDGEPTAAPKDENAPRAMTSAADDPQTLSPDEEEAWQACVKDLRDRIASRQWTAAKQVLVEQRPSVKTASQRAEFESLQSALELLQEADEALASAVTRLSGGDMLQVRSKTLAFVEGDAQQLVLRIDGQNQRFRLAQLPVGILEALLDLELDSVNRRAQAAKAAYVMLFSRGTALVMPRLEKSLQAAQQAEIIAADTARVLQQIVQAQQPE